MVAVGEDQRVQRPGGVLGRLEHAGQPGHPGRSRELAEVAGEGTVQRLGVRREVGAGLAEVAGEGLGQHHEVGPVAQVGGDLVEGRAVLRRIETGGPLHQPDTQGGHARQTLTRGRRVRDCPRDRAAAGARWDRAHRRVRGALPGGRQGLDRDRRDDPARARARRSRRGARRGRRRRRGADQPSGHLPARGAAARGPAAGVLAGLHGFPARPGRWSSSRSTCR